MGLTTFVLLSHHSLLHPKSHIFTPVEIKGMSIVQRLFKLYSNLYFYSNKILYRKIPRNIILISSNGNSADGSMSRYPLEDNMATTTKAVFVVDESLCYGCGACIALCPTNALDLVDRLAIVEQDDCTLCEHCIPSCPVFALSIKDV